ncbi:hypothetical protein FLGE108171_09120 [Flavobacterium gelidilacus]|jgi:hypothetical protein|uniref:hypothetical protein n=1 Tax=Flavobacterium gelidilacus TaxID=206041 RepID=UPI000421F895|nr:hypothetical protein [Flavobacterium gelidilacus]
MKYQPELTCILLWIEIIASIIALAFYSKTKKTYWIWFTFYLFVIAFSDNFIDDLVFFFNIKKQFFYAYILIPIQFVFFYWLYALKSLGKKKLFWSCIILYTMSFIPIELYFSKLKVVYSFNYVIGTLLLMLLVFVEFRKQIKNDDILEFSKNKMFYINIGVMLFYVGTLPFFGLYNLIANEVDIWNIYYIYFLVSNCIMYLLFAASFIWGKPK